MHNQVILQTGYIHTFMATFTFHPLKLTRDRDDKVFFLNIS